MCNSTGMVIANGITWWNNINGCKCGRHNRDNVVEYFLANLGVMPMYNASHLSHEVSSRGHYELYIDLLSTKVTKHVKHILDGQPSHLFMDFKHAPRYASMVVSTTWKTLHVLGINVPPKKNWEVFKDTLTL